MKTFIGIIVAILIVLGIVWAVDIDTSGDVEMPSVSADVDAEGGELPEVDADTADVDVGTEETDVTVPSDVDVETQEESVTVPTMDVESPEEDTNTEQNDVETEIDNDPANQR